MKNTHNADLLPIAKEIKVINAIMESKLGNILPDREIKDFLSEVLLSDFVSIYGRHWFGMGKPYIKKQLSIARCSYSDLVDAFNSRYETFRESYGKIYPKLSELMEADYEGPHVCGG